MSKLFDYRLARRLITIPATLIGASLLIVCTPVLLIVAAVAAVASGSTQLGRRVLLVTVALVIEVLGLIAALVLWVITGFGLATSTRWSHRLHARLMGFYTSALLGLITRFLVDGIEPVKGLDTLSPGPIVVAARHTSFFDALLPASLMQRKHHRLIPHHVLARGLILAPCIDVVGHRFTNEFVRRVRAGDNRESAQLDRIRALGSELDLDSGAVIFPEGTFRTPERFQRAIERARMRDPEQAERLSTLAHTLPPHPNGVFTLLEGSPTADLVICLNTGLESFNSAATVAALARSSRPLRVECWRFERSSIPTADRHVFAEWFVDRWFEVDAWVEANA